MCLRCDGYSEDDVLRAIDLNVRVHGFHICAVEGTRPWTYTIGVPESAGHPDLVVTDVETEQAGELLWHVVRHIDDVGGLDAADLEADGIRVVPVHPSHRRGRGSAVGSARRPAPEAGGVHADPAAVGVVLRVPPHDGHETGPSGDAPPAPAGAAVDPRRRDDFVPNL